MNLKQIFLSLSFFAVSVTSLAENSSLTTITRWPISQDERTQTLANSIRDQAQIEHFQEIVSIDENMNPTMKKYTRYSGLAALQTPVLAASSLSASRGSGEYSFDKKELCSLLGHQDVESYLNKNGQTKVSEVAAQRRILKVGLIFKDTGKKAYPYLVFGESQAEQQMKILVVGETQSTDTVWKREMMSYVGAVIASYLGPFVEGGKEFGNHSSREEINAYNRKVELENKNHVPAIYHTLVYDSILCVD